MTRPAGSRIARESGSLSVSQTRSRDSVVHADAGGRGSGRDGIHHGRPGRWRSRARRISPSLPANSRILSIDAQPAPAARRGDGRRSRAGRGGVESKRVLKSLGKTSPRHALSPRNPRGFTPAAVFSMLREFKASVVKRLAATPSRSAQAHESRRARRSLRRVSRGAAADLERVESNGGESEPADQGPPSMEVSGARTAASPLRPALDALASSSTRPRPLASRIVSRWAGLWPPAPARVASGVAHRRPKVDVSVASNQHGRRERGRSRIQRAHEGRASVRLLGRRVQPEPPRDAAARPRCASPRRRELPRRVAVRASGRDDAPAKTTPPLGRRRSGRCPALPPRQRPCVRRTHAPSHAQPVRALRLPHVSAAPARTPARRTYCGRPLRYSR